MYKREFVPPNLSYFLFGPRMTGKTSILRKTQNDLFVDLLDPTEELRLRAEPKLFWEMLSALKNGSQIIVDEVQKVTSLLDYVQMAMDQKQMRFSLSGSSARKLKKGGANLLGGRAADLKLFPLTAFEIGTDFNIEAALHTGTLPRIYSLFAEKKIPEMHILLQSYITTYIKEEIQAEALVRKLDAFQRFLPVAAQANGTLIEYANISRECAVHMNTVKDYHQILEDTLIGNFLWPAARSERKKMRPKFYFFDCGVLRSLQGLATSKSEPR